MAAVEERGQALFPDTHEEPQAVGSREERGSPQDTCSHIPVPACPRAAMASVLLSCLHFSAKQTEQLLGNTRVTEEAAAVDTCRAVDGDRHSAQDAEPCCQDTSNC